MDWRRWGPPRNQSTIQAWFGQHSFASLRFSSSFQFALRQAPVFRVEKKGTSEWNSEIQSSTTKVNFTNASTDWAGNMWDFFYMLWSNAVIAYTTTTACTKALSDHYWKESLLQHFPEISYIHMLAFHSMHAVPWPLLSFHNSYIEHPTICFWFPRNYFTNRPFFIREHCRVQMKKGVVN